MIPEQIEHLGIAVPSIEAALPYYENVPLQYSVPQYQDAQFVQES